MNKIIRVMTQVVLPLAAFVMLALLVLGALGPYARLAEWCADRTAEGRVPAQCAAWRGERL